MTQFLRKKKGLLLLIATSFLFCSGFDSCGRSNCANSPCFSFAPPPPPCPPTTPGLPAGGFCVNVTDTNGNVTVPHNQAVVTGAWQGDIANPTGTGKSFNFNGNTASWPQYCKGCRINANWAGTYQLANDIPCSSALQQWGGTITASSQTWPNFNCVLNTSSSAFFLVNSIPTSLTVASSGISAGGGLPLITLFSADQAVISTQLASSISADGTSATFPFPKDKSGNPLPVGHYAYTLSNQLTPGQYSAMALSFLSIGNLDLSHISPYGVDAYDTKNVQCTTTPDTCVTSGGSGVAFTLSGSSQVGWGTGVFAVGTQPVAIKLYGTNHTQTSHCGGGRTGNCTSIDVYTPQGAVVANFGSNTVSLLDYRTGSVLATLAVGKNPGAIAVTPDASKAYVANYGDGTVSEILLAATQSVDRTVAVGNAPSALAVDPSGTTLWVGGNGFITSLDLASLNSTSTTSISGQVTSVSVIPSQNSIFYTMLAPDMRTFSAEQIATSTKAHLASYAVTTIPGTPAKDSSAYYYVADVVGTTKTPPTWFLASGALVTATYGGRYVVVGTPNGFEVEDIQTYKNVLSATLPSPVRGIATDPNQGNIYITTPDSNGLYTVPFPPIP